MRVALIHPPPASIADRHWARFPILGLAYLAGSLRNAGHEVVLYDGKLDDLSAESIALAVSREAPDLVGITCMTVEYPMAARIAGLIKSTTQVPIVVGGAHVNAVRESALTESESFDYGCVGEGEFLILELLEAIAGGRELATVNGLIYRTFEGVRRNPDRPYPADYDQLAFPNWDLFSLGDQIPILTHRGCPFKCNFCGHNSGFKARFRTPDNVLKEIDYIVTTYRPRTIRFEDETFGLNPRRTKEILSGIIDRGYPSLVAFSAQTRVDRIDEELIDLLKAANFETLELGVESGNPLILRASGKAITLEQVEHAVTLAKDRGLRVWCKFILGHPYENEDTVRDTVRFIRHLNPNQLSVAIMTPFPGTPIHEMALKREGGYRLLKRGWENYDKYSSGALELDGLSLSKLKAYQIWCYASLYLFNLRFADSLRLVLSHKALAWEMLTGLMREVVSRKQTSRSDIPPSPKP